MSKEAKHEDNTTSALNNKSLQEQEKPPEATESPQQDDTSTQASSTAKETLIQGVEATESEEKTQAKDIPQESVRNSHTKVSPKDWQKHHDNWLNVVMRYTIGDPKPPTIPDLHAHILVPRPSPDLNIEVAPIKNYVT